MSTIMLATGSATGRPTPMAAAIGSSMGKTPRAPARRAAPTTARRSTAVIPEGTAMTTWGEIMRVRLWTRRMKYLSMASVISKSAITPSFMGRMAS